ncbi:hypothetical protein ACIA5C_13970 [Actinoplanes sp. NPDC051343]|uniref:hypothetical protein n=1 Tax=Actinoplanes sp. NPDC051343 TaxID=3363906 RepID=UPI0037A06BD6
MGRLLRAEGLVPATGLAVFLMIFGLFGGAQDPAPQALWVGTGLLLAPAGMVYAHRWAAAWAGIFCALAWTSLSGPYVAVAVVWAYAAISVLIAQRDRPHPAEPVPRRRPPQPVLMPKVARATEATGAALIALAALGLGYVWSDVRAAPLLTLVIPAAGLGCALLARAAHRQHALRDLFALPQPAHSVRVVEQVGYLHVLLPSADGQTALEFGFDVAEPDEPEDDDPRTVEAVLFGEPRTGAWCAVEVGGRLHVPVGPVGEVITVPYDVVDGLPREIEDDEEQLVDPSALRPADAGGDAYRTREHRIAPQRAWVATVTIGLGAALGAGELGKLVLPRFSLVLVAVAAAAGYEFGWRNQLRPRLRWHAGGIATVGFRGVDRQPWATDSAVLHDDRGSVLLTAGESVLTVPAPAPWPQKSGQRTADELVAALRVARTRSFEISPLAPPPEIAAPRRPFAIYPAWLLTVVVTMLIVVS